MPSYLENLKRQASRQGLEPRSRKSLEWFRKRVQNIKNVNRRELLDDEALEERRRTSLGKMYMFRYQAKHKDTLPYYDRFPLIFMVDRAPKGFYGINLHYLPPTIRAIFFDKLLDVANNDKFNSKTKLKISYDILNGVTKYKEFRPCFKRYLTAYMRSQPIFVPASEWEAVLFLPSDSFIGAKRDFVWKESRKIIRG